MMNINRKNQRYLHNQRELKKYPTDFADDTGFLYYII